MEHNHIRDRKGMALKILRVVDVKVGINIFQRFTGRELRRIDHLVIIPVNRETLLFQPVKRHKAQIVRAVR